MSSHSLLVALVIACSAPAVAAALPCDERAAPRQTEPSQQQTTPAGDAKRAPEVRRWMWWRVPATKAEIGITDQQATEIDQIFQAAMPTLRTAKEELDKLDAEVAQVIKGATADDGTVSRLVGRAEHARARLTITRTVMYYRMRLILSADQRARLNAMIERWEAERRKTTDSTSRR